MEDFSFINDITCNVKSRMFLDRSCENKQTNKMKKYCYDFKFKISHDTKKRKANFCIIKICVGNELLICSGFMITSTKHYHKS